MAESRQHGRTTFTTPSDRELVATRTFDAPRDITWEMHTSRAHIPQWLLGPDGWSMPVCEMDVREGGAWQYRWQGPDGSSFGMHGVYREVNPPARLVHTEAWGNEWPETINTTEFSEQGGKTTIVCTVLYPSKEIRDRAIATGMEAGWAQSYDRLDGYLVTVAAAPR